MNSSATLSDDGQFRWTLERAWSDGPTVCWIMLNPSTADAEVDDPTIRAIVKHSDGWGFGRLVVVNLYPIRSSDPKAARRWAVNEWREDKSVSRLDHNFNIVVGEAKAAEKVMAAWGAAPWTATWVRAVTDAIPELYCLGRTASGAPKHPLARGRHRVETGQQPELWAQQ